MLRETIRALVRPPVRLFCHQEWVRFGIRSRLARLIDPPDTAADEPFEVDFYTMRYRGVLSSYLDWSVYYYGAYAVEELHFMEHLLRQLPAATVLDVGANIGHHSLFSARFAHRVLAIEPFPALAAQIASKAQDNSLHERLQVVQVAFGDEPGQATFYASATKNQGTGTLSTTRSEGKVPAAVVNVVRGDDMLAELHVGHVDLVKLDAEGFEAPALRGLQRTLQASRPVVFFEWSEDSAERLNGSSLWALLPDGYELYEFIPQRPLGVFFNRPGFALRALSARSSLPPGERNYFACPAERVALISMNVVP